MLTRDNTYNTLKFTTLMIAMDLVASTNYLRGPRSESWNASALSG